MKYALKELLPGKTAAEILELKVCEPAMGSAAFLNEVVNQLAQAYLELRQQETSKSIPHEQFATELQKVKMRLADQNVFGVDLNPVAVELAEVSLWLNSIFTPEKGRAFVPWFSQQLVCGNSLISARRQIYRVNQLPTSTARSAKPRKLWHEHAPEELAWDAELPDDGIFHFLLPDQGMAAYTDKVIKQLEPEAIERCKKWNKAFVGDVFTESQIAHLQRLSRLVDSLWKDWTAQQQQLRERTTDPLPVWEDPTGAEEGDWTPLLLKDRIQEQEVQGRDVANTNARLRLKWAMDYWVALWFWPISEAGSLPSRDTWLFELSMILGDLEQGISEEPGQIQLFPDTQPRQLAADFSDRHGVVRIDKLKEDFKRLQQVEVVTKQIRPLHWDLEFSDLLGNGGFDLVTGNPPWIKIIWEPSSSLEDHDPYFKIRSFSASSATKEIISLASKKEEFKKNLANEFTAISGTLAFLGSPSNYSLLNGSTLNAYKAFISKSFEIACNRSLIALLTPAGHFSEPKAGRLRSECIKRMSLLVNFENQLKLFQEIGNTRKFSITLLKGRSKHFDEESAFRSLSNCFHPRTLDECDQPSSTRESTPCPAIKEKGKWVTKGHPERMITYNKQLRESSKIFLNSADEEFPPLLFLHNTRSAKVVEKIAMAGRSFKDLANTNEIEYIRGIPEKQAQDNNQISKESHFPANAEDMFILSAHIGNGKPFSMSPKRVCDTHRAFEVYNPAKSTTNAFPRTTFRFNDITQGSAIYSSFSGIDCSSGDFAGKILMSKRIDLSGERSVFSAIYPNNVVHTGTVVGITSQSKHKLVLVQSFLASIFSDFQVRVSGAADLTKTIVYGFPFPFEDVEDAIESILLNRLYYLNYDPVFEDFYADFFEIRTAPSAVPGWSSSDTRLENSALKAPASYFTCRQALLEIDVLIAMQLGLTLPELIESYRSVFGVAQQYEADTWFDRNGRIVFTASKGLTGVGFPRKGKGRGANKEMGWEDIADMTSGTVSRSIIDDTLPGGPVERTITYEAPFDRCDRVEDYKIAWEFFEREGIN